MNHFKKSMILLMLLTVIAGSRLLAQPCLGTNFLSAVPSKVRYDSPDHEHNPRVKAKGNFYCNPLLLDGKALELERLMLKDKGELTLIKGAPDTGHTVSIPFYIYVRRGGKPISSREGETSLPKRMKVEISTILQFAEPGDEIVIDPVNAEDWPAKRILKLNNGC